MEKFHAHTVQEVISAIDSELTHEEKNKIFETPSNKILDLHMSFGMFIRNAFVYNNPNKVELAVSCAKASGAEHPEAASETYLSMKDCFSSVLMRAYWKHLLLTFDPENPDHPLPLPPAIEETSIVNL